MKPLKYSKEKGKDEALIVSHNNQELADKRSLFNCFQMGSSRWEREESWSIKHYFHFLGWKLGDKTTKRIFHLSPVQLPIIPWAARMTRPRALKVWWVKRRIIRCQSSCSSSTTQLGTSRAPPNSCLDCHVQIYLGVELLGHLVTPYLTFSETAWLQHFTFPPTMYRSSNFSTSSLTLITIFLYFFNYSSSGGWGTLPQF